MSLARYASIVLTISGASLALLALLPGADPATRGAVLFGASLATFNTLLAHFLILWSSGRSTAVFLRAVLGGMIARMALMLMSTVAGILWLSLPKIPLAVSLLSYFGVFLVLELFVLQKRMPAGLAAR